MIMLLYLLGKTFFLSSFKGQILNSQHQFSSGSQTQKIKVINFTGEELSTIRYHEGFLGRRIGPISSLAFHP
jgi:hypothetical protein